MSVDPLTAALGSGRHEFASRIVRVGRHRIELLHVANLEALVDREAVLRSDDPVEPPYWAHLWTGAIELALHLDGHHQCAGQAVLDVGCGLGLVGIVAAVKGARVTFLDRDPDALAFAAASAERNGCRPAGLRQADFTRDNLGWRFDLILAAEVLYDAAAFIPLVRFFSAHLKSGGTVILADAHRTDTRAFYDALTSSGYRFTTRTISVREERLPLAIDIVTARRIEGGDPTGRQIGAAGMAISQGDRSGEKGQEP